MTFRTAPLLLLAVMFGFLGCRDALVDEPLQPGAQTPPADSSTQNTIYLKGPEELQVDETRNYRAEPLQGAVEYRWSMVGGLGGVTGVTSDPLLRVYDITGVSAGIVQLSVRAYGEDDEVLGVGSKTVTVIR